MFNKTSSANDVKADSVESPFLNPTHGFLFVSNKSKASQLVTLGLDSRPITVLCQMRDFGCGDGGWTPVMKTDGNKVSLI